MSGSMAPGRPDRGTTLLEILIVVILMGVVINALTVVLATTFRTAPGVSGRNDDSRSLLGLVTYMPEDVNSTPPGNFDFDPGRPSGCSDSGAGVNLVHMTWNENVGSSVEYQASYRYIDDGDGYRIQRFACATGDTTTKIRAMSSVLPAIDESTWSNGTTPIYISESTDADGAVNGLTLQIDTLSGSTVDLEMRTNNPDETLAPLVPTTPGTTGTPNGAPTADPVVVTTTKGAPVTFRLPVSDPNGDGLIVTHAAIPPGWTRTLSGTTMTLDPRNSHPEGFVTTIAYRAADPRGAVADSTITVEIVAAVGPNTPPSANPVNVTGDAEAALLVNLPVADADADPLTVTWSGADPSLDISVTDTTMSITSDGTVANPPPFTYTVTDPDGASASNTVQVTVNTCQVTGLSPSSVEVDLKKNGRLKNSVDFGVTFNGPCTDLVLEYDNDLGDGTYDPTFLSFGSGNTVTVQGHPGGLNWSDGDHTMTLKDGLGGSPLFTATLDVEG